MQQEEKKKSILENSSKYVTRLFDEKLPEWAVYHDLSHTIDTVNACELIGLSSGLKREELELLQVAAWFHDTGYIFQIDRHEEKSAEIAFNYLSENKYSTDSINEVINCIMATKISIIPKNLMESVICDSDLISLGSKDYFQKNDLLKQEIELRENKKINELEWLKRSLNFIKAHNYYTEYSMINFMEQLENNIVTLRHKINGYRY